MAKKNKYAGFSKISKTIDLHDLNGSGLSINQNDVFNALHEFILDTEEEFQNIIKQSKPLKIGIICGKGINSRRFINGKILLDHMLKSM